MKLVKKILNKFNGLQYPQEYLCFAKETFQHPLHVYLFAGGQVIKDITDSHLFTGYCPLIFVLHSSSADDPLLNEEITIIFSQEILPLNEFLKEKDAVATLSLKRVRKQTAGDTTLFYYEGTNGSHHFLSSFHQWILGLNNRLYNKKPGNVFLNDNLYKQVQVAYGVPRIISLITVTDGHSYNLFPTDLHGAINEHYYVGSLRHEGKACQQVESSGMMVISQIHAGAYKMAFTLGKNHMQELKPKEDFPFGELNSSLFLDPLPQPVLSYRELQLIESFTHGIHKLLLFKIMSQHTVSDEPATLAHIHNVYATWRYNKGLAGNYLLR